MRFLTTRRVWLDVITFDKLSELFETTRGIIPRDKVYDNILRDWIDSGGDIRVRNLFIGPNILRTCLIWVIVEEDLWNDFKILCYGKELNVNSGFKIAVFRFIDMLDNDTEILYGLL